ncbi:MAG TPA: 2-C-methyl-D-erythritol 2,4-cyclodiphosphate synthase [Balneola sp.]|jgi:2-C-methyl-D-erythritol 2,4-cyclodiphosphate synthase|nr:2-C-methyl-D-erythritol 2,4-cyclodiphosphate synthase [Balneola sp.]MBF65674.1 2-C-methyl-D-erythritol 2,4-cyclodiphosphate synthase [Balneola sp.]HAW81937.1 2-C-methyl-D-erythritol 2,4-cyclodiphosphate synthase [Balneola sp.]HBZ38529.1 2-C-methyl-D-erythritol 2,4-cyclodiphosphate synthase [Balneola sp.]HCT53159.1 2-C-methyl-D-erythritol 2,4-cyclodiphosphate synthase [Balneola sp.]|tara:strand:- start:949 stop:1434 length:486 start_codon:yes stop_codon:yes gene_type:complete
MKNIRIGYGYDVHKLVSGRKLILGGVEIPHIMGLEGHSDADVLLHTITDAMLGALALGDIGTHFPDTDLKYKNVDSRILLRKAYGLVKEKNYELGNLDATIVAQEPKLKPYILQIRETIALDLNTDIENVSVKATTSEWLGFEGRKEGVSSSAVVLLTKID